MLSIIQSLPIYQMMFNSVYKENQSYEDSNNYGSKKIFSTDCFINGEYFRSRTNNQYFCVVDKNIKLSDVHNFISDFRELEQAIKIKNFNPEKHNILRLEFTKNKKYFVESYQAIGVCYDRTNYKKEKPDVTIMNISLEELRKITPKFEPLPQG